MDTGSGHKAWQHDATARASVAHSSLLAFDLNFLLQRIYLLTWSSVLLRSHNLAPSIHRTLTNQTLRKIPDC